MRLSSGSAGSMRCPPPSAVSRLSRKRLASALFRCRGGFYMKVDSLIRVIDMARLASCAAVLGIAVISFSTSAQAQTVYENGFMPAPDAYANLPGVKDPKTLRPKERYNCYSTSVQSGYPDGAYRDVFGSQGLPVQGYRCTGSAGGSATGTRAPTSRDWYPGINPPAVDF